jgi:hypothetical protein
MKLLLALLAASVVCAAPAWADTISEQDVAKIKADIVAMYAAFEKGDPSLVMANTHESALALFGGKEAMAQVTQETLQQMAQLRIKFLSSETGTPTQTYPAGEEEVCFVPRIALMEAQGQKVKVTGFMVAIRHVGGHDWKYLDGAPISKDPALLRMLLPKLTSDVELPPSNTEVLM